MGGCLLFAETVLVAPLFSKPRLVNQTISAGFHLDFSAYFTRYWSQMCVSLDAPGVHLLFFCFQFLIIKDGHTLSRSVGCFSFCCRSCTSVLVQLGSWAPSADAFSLDSLIRLRAAILFYFFFPAKTSLFTHTVCYQLQICVCFCHAE